MLCQCMLSKLARVTALVRPRKLPAGPPWTPSPPLSSSHRRLLSFQHAGGGVRVAHGTLLVATCIGLLCEYECCIDACVAFRTEVVSVVTCRLMFTPRVSHNRRLELKVCDGDEYACLSGPAGPESPRVTMREA